MQASLPAVAVAAVALAVAAAGAPAAAGAERAAPAAMLRPPAVEASLLLPTRRDVRALPPIGSRGAWSGGPVVTSTGESVTIYASALLGADAAERTRWAEFFAWLYHGPELAGVTVYETTLDDVGSICGSRDAAGCYSPSQRALVFPGDVDAGMDAEIAAHEYGHHVAASRRNDPWDPGDWGPKRWASYVDVCARAAAGTVFPGDEDEHYALNSGEAFAEAYRLLNEQRGGTWAYPPLVVDPALAPDAGSLAAALADVQQPWSGPSATSWDGSVAAPASRLTATVGPGSTIALRRAGGGLATSLGAGTYAIAVRDLSARDNFHLRGPGVDLRTSVARKASVVWRVRLGAGTYRYSSDAHPALGGRLAVAAEAPLPPQERRLETPLDGELVAAASGSARPALELVDAETGEELAEPSAGAVSYTLCGQRSVVLRVLPARAGSFHLEVAVP